METIVSRSPLNETQILLLQTFSRINDEEVKNDIQNLLLDYCRKKVDEGMDKWWAENEMTLEKFDEMTKDIHFRTPYK